MKAPDDTDSDRVRERVEIALQGRNIKEVEHCTTQLSLMRKALERVLREMSHTRRCANHSEGGRYPCSCWVHEARAALDKGEGE